MGFLAKLFGGSSEKRRQEEEEAYQREYELHTAHLKELMDEFADAERMKAKKYRELSVGETKTARRRPSSTSSTAARCACTTS